MVKLPSWDLQLWGLGFRLWGLGFRVWGSSGTGFTGLGFRVPKNDGIYSKHDHPGGLLLGCVRGPPREIKANRACLCVCQDAVAAPSLPKCIFT